MKLKLWHLILQKIVKVSSGQKNQTFCQIYMKKSFLSLPITFSVLVNVIPYQIFIQNPQITVFKKNSTKSGALPLLQECPITILIIVSMIIKQTIRSVVNHSLFSKCDPRNPRDLALAWEFTRSSVCDH